MTMRRALISGVLWLGALAAPAGTLAAQSLERYSVARQFHGEVHLAAAVDFAGGTLEVGPGDPASLYAMQLVYDAERFEPESRWAAGSTAVTLGLTTRGKAPLGVRRNSHEQTGHVQFSPQADLDLSLALGAATSTVDLGGLRLSSLVLETGASQTEVRFGRPNAIRCTAALFRAGAASLTVTGLGNSRCDRVTFEGGMGSVVLDYTGEWSADASLQATLAVGGLTLRIPRGVGVTMSTERFLATFQPPGFTRQGNRYTSIGNATARHHLDVTLTTSLGGVTVEWVD